MELTEKKFLEWFAVWANDGRSPLTKIMGYAEMVRICGDLNETQQKYIQRIQDAVKDAAQGWSNPSSFLTLRYSSSPHIWDWEATDLSKVIQFFDKTTIFFDLPNQLPLVRADSNWLEVAIGIFLRPSSDHYRDPNFDTSMVAYKKNETTIRVKIRSGLQLMSEQTELETISSPGKSIHLALLIIEKHESQLEFRQIRDTENGLSKGTEFEFDLPIWKEE